MNNYFKNPIMPGADPFVLLHEDRYYMYCTNSDDKGTDLGYFVYESEDLVNWENKGLCLDKEDVMGDKWFWAPEVLMYKGRFYMVYAADEHIAVASADHPLGPFKQENKRWLRNEGAIDGSFFVDDDGSVYMLGLESENEYEELGLNSLTVVAIAETGWPGGMGYVYELSDGSFFIIDGGYFNGSTVSSAEWLTKTLQQMASDPRNIRIAAWYMTHPHEDHMGAYCDMAKRTECRRTMTIEKMIINVPADEYVKSAGCEDIVGWLDSALDKWTPEQIVKAHPGQQFYIADLTLTIYSSPDLVLPQNVTITDLNELCNVAMVDYMGKRALFMGDSDTIPNPKIARNYTDSLKADILQLSHHGYGDTNAGVVYDYVHPTIVFWPVCDEHYNDGNGSGVQFIGFNQRFFKEGIANYIASDLNMTFTDFDTWIPDEERWNPKEN
jgi:hypothetical protein